nr:phosphoribosylformylglycinamidine synthase subunit PurS [Caldilineaceae bacterium]
MAVFRFTISFDRPDPRSGAFLADTRALGFASLTAIECQDVYFVEGDLDEADLQRLATKLLADPVTQQARWTQLPAHEPASAGRQLVEVALRPGVTDPVAHEIVRAAHELGVTGVVRAATGLRFLLDGADATTAARLATRLLANAVIHHWTLGAIAPSFPLDAAATDQTESIPLRGLDDAALLALSQARRAALDLAEMQALQRYCEQIHRDLTDVEFETIAQTWSEHCVHKTFKAHITVDREGEAPTVVDSIYRSYIRRATETIAAPWVLSAFVDNAGIIDLDGVNEVSFKVETHNHPSAIEPFGGANTGVGGVIRDVLGVSHKPVANTDVLCFGPQQLPLESLPEGVLHPRVIMSGVVAGVQDYGNKIGIPTVNGAILFDAGYTANPLVFCGTVGIAPQGMRPDGPRPGDRVVVLGGRTGRDGLRGATFSSMTMDAQTGEVAGSSVQIGDPITEKGLIDVVVRARDERLYHAITDCGAGGLSSAVGEMASELGAEVDLTRVRLKYPGLAPWEIWLSEAQERMVLAVPPDALPRLQALCDTFDTELT